MQIHRRRRQKKYCSNQTQCFSIPLSGKEFIPKVGTTQDLVENVKNSLLDHWYKSITTTAINPKFDTIFGTAFFCVGIIAELLRIGVGNTIISRGGLRTIVESYITLAYLVAEDDPELWKSHRVFGAGQAKLAFLKLTESGKEPSYVDFEVLSEIANEDMWEEFLPIELGHWEKSNLRTLSIKAGVKDVYDNYYIWTSNFSHGHWASIRDSVFDICGNPLHRLDRIPRKVVKALPDVLPDATVLVDNILEIVSKCYPEFSARLAVEN